MILIKGKEKHTLVDVSNEELKAMYDSWLADTQMTSALIKLPDRQFGINVIIPDGQTIRQIKGSLKIKTNIVKEFLEEFKRKING